LIGEKSKSASQKHPISYGYFSLELGFLESLPNKNRLLVSAKAIKSFIVNRTDMPYWLVWFVMKH